MAAQCDIATVSIELEKLIKFSCLLSLLQLFDVVGGVLFITLTKALDMRLP